MLISHRRALSALRRARRTGAPYTTPAHPLHWTLHEMVVLGIVCGRRIDDRTFWSEEVSSAKGCPKVLDSGRKGTQPKWRLKSATV